MAHFFFMNSYLVVKYVHVLSAVMIFKPGL